MNKDKKILMRPKYIGKPIERFEDSKFLSGNAKYTSDINIDKMLQLVFVRSDEAHAKIKYIEYKDCLLYTSPSPRDRQKSRMPSSA